MKSLKYGLSSLVLLLLFASLSEAQVSNVTVRAQWDPNPVDQQVTHYTLTVDGGTPITIQSSACQPTVCEQSITTTFANHTFTLTATNLSGTSPAATATINLSLPGIPVNFRINR